MPRGNGVFIVVLIAASAVFAGGEAVYRLLHPATVDHVGWVAAAGVIGFVGNELVAVYRIRVGRDIGSAALVADGMRARTNGLTSLAMVVGAVGVALGWPLADPLVGLLITVLILVVLTQLGVLRRGRAELEAVLDVGLAHPVAQTGLRDSEVGSDLLDRLPRLTAMGDVHDVVAELLGIAFRHMNGRGGPLITKSIGVLYKRSE